MLNQVNAEEYITLNRSSWNKRVPVHIESDFYAMDAFMKGASSLNDIELDLMGDIKGKSILHLQCHFGQDSLSLSRMGAKVTGVDFSDIAIHKAQELNVACALDAEFICCDIYELKEYLDKKFDIVFTTYGTIGWLPDIARWAELIAHFLKPGGKLVFADFHPVVWMLDENFEGVKYNYFNAEPIIEKSEGTYADTKADIQYETSSWNHSLDEVIGALLGCALQITSFREYDYSPYNCFKGMEKMDERKYRVTRLGNKIPIVYSITATKKV
jgi:2-polyprenyl-3-methyl-5-hydroxy-6-metoxy-1,4-benzoquinol methylase